MMETKIARRYRVLRSLDGEESERTLLAEDLAIPQVPQCVIKMYSAERFGDLPPAEVDRRFQEGVERLSMLGTHDRIPGIRDHFTLDGVRHLVVEYVEGRSLSAEFQLREALGDHAAAMLLYEVVETLAFVHSNEAIHGDIKASNVIRRAADGALALVGFEIPDLPSLPEQSRESDLRGAALVAIQSMAGREFRKLERDPSTGEISWRGHLKMRPEFADILERMLRPAGQGFASASEAHLDLAQLLQVPGSQPPPTPAGRPRSHPLSSADVRPGLADPYDYSPGTGGRPSPPLDGPPASGASPVRSSSLPLVLGIVAIVLLGIGMIVVLGAVVHNFIPINSADSKSSNHEIEESQPHPSRPDPEAFDRGLKAKEKAERIRLEARTKPDWYTVADAFSYAATQFTRVDPENPHFARAQLEAESCTQSMMDARTIGNRLPIESTTNAAPPGPIGETPSTVASPAKEVTPPKYGNYLIVTSTGKSTLYTQQTHSLSVSASASGEISIHVDSFGSIRMKGPGKGDLTAGTYQSALSQYNDLEPYLSISGLVRCSRREQASFVIHRIRYAPKQPNDWKREITELEASFDVNCSQDDGRIRGRLRFTGVSGPQSNWGAN